MATEMALSFAFGEVSGWVSWTTFWGLLAGNPDVGALWDCRQTSKDESVESACQGKTTVGIPESTQHTVNHRELFQMREISDHFIPGLSRGFGELVFWNTHIFDDLIFFRAYLEMLEVSSSTYSLKCYNCFWKYPQNIIFNSFRCQHHLHELSGSGFRCSEDRNKVKDMNNLRFPGYV